MLLAGYFLGFLILWLCIRKRSQRVRSLIIVGYNYLVITAMYAVPMLSGGLPGVSGTADVILQSLYGAVAALAFEGDLGMVNSGLQFTCLFFIASLCTVYAVLVLFFRRALNLLAGLWHLFRAREVCAAVGDREDARVLLEDVRVKAPRMARVYIPLVQEDGEPEDIPGALTRDWAWLLGLRPGKRYHVVLLPDGQGGNLTRLQELDGLGERLEALRVTACLDNDLLRLEDLHLNHADACLVSREGLLARAFLTEHLPLAELKSQGGGTVQEGVWVPDGPFRLCIAGFGPVAREFLLATYENTAFETAVGPGLQALILDEAAVEQRAVFCQDFPRFREEPGVVWKAAGPASDEFFAAVEAQLPGLHEVLIDTGDTRRNLDTAQRLLRLFRRQGLGAAHPLVAVVIRDEAPGGAGLLAEDGRVCFLRADGIRDPYEELVLRATDEQAEALHRRYSATSLHGDNWRTLGTFTQTSNRAVVWDIPNKLLLGAEVDSLSGPAREAALWRLARYEHRRWNAFHFAHGWTTLPAWELTEDERSRCATKRREERRHACLVDWDELDALPQSEPGILKRYDYENAAQLFSGAGGEEAP